MTWVRYRIARAHAITPSRVGSTRSGMRGWSGTELVWTLAEHRSTYVELRPERAGYAMVSVFLDDLDGFVESAAALGIHPETLETYGNGVRKATYRDPDGNEISFGGGPVEDGADGP